MSLSLVFKMHHLLPKQSLVQDWLRIAAFDNKPVMANYCYYIGLNEL